MLSAATTKTPSPRPTWHRFPETLLMLAILVPGATLVGQHARALSDEVKVTYSLGAQVAEVAANVQMAVPLLLDVASAEGANASPAVAAAAKKLELQQVTPAGLQRMFSMTGKPVAELLKATRENTVLQPNEAVPGLFWKDGHLRNEWGGEVSVYRKDRMTLVAYTKVPEKLCGELQLGRYSGAGSYLFACNEDLIAVENGRSWRIAIP